MTQPVDSTSLTARHEMERAALRRACTSLIAAATALSQECEESEAVGRAVRVDEGAISLSYRALLKSIGAVLLLQTLGLKYRAKKK